MSADTRWLVVRLAAPLMSFGAVAIDQVGPTARWPGASLLTGLIGNALGWDWTDRAAHQVLQDRLRFGAVEMQAGGTLTDIQNAQLGKDDRGWTTQGTPEGRTGDSYAAPHRRRRDYIADADYRIVLTLNDPKTAPTLDDVANALDRPARPLFLGRKPCLPAGRLFYGEVRATNVQTALARLGAKGRMATWPEEEGSGGTRTMDSADLRIWSSGLHGGSRKVVEGRL